ncbi:hypothetical protein LINGRAHAP2_LOCUS19473 [Linum grandiflorum]
MVVRGTSLRAKRVTDPLDDRARARLIGAFDQLSYVSSGSEHSAVDVDVDDDHSPCLSDLVQCFLEQEASASAAVDSVPLGYDSDDQTESVSDSADCVGEIIALGFDSVRNVLSAQVCEAVEVFSAFQDQKPTLRRKVMSYLRESGRNAGICKTRWDSTGGLTSGSYEFVDVFVSSNHRYIVDLEFAPQFEIARPSAQYQRLMESLPNVFVGSVEDLKRIVRTMSDAARKSLKSRGLSLPPWRKNRYMINKWLGPYKRTVNPLPEIRPSFPSAIGGQVVGEQCRFVGFGVGVGGRLAVRT